MASSRIQTDPTPLMAVDAIGLPPVAVGARAEATVTVVTVDSVPLRVVDAQWEDDAPAFDVQTLADGRLRLGAVPAAPGEHWAFLRVVTEEGVEGTLPVSVEGRAGVLRVQVDAPVNVPIGCEIEGHVWLENSGTEAVEVASIQAEGEAWSVAWEGPFVLVPGATESVPLTRSAAPEGDHSPRLSVVSDAYAEQRLDEDFAASGAEAEAIWTTATVPRLGAVDLVVVTGTENLGMMGDVDPTLDGVPALAQALTDAGLDWQMTVISNASGCPSAAWPVLTAESALWAEPAPMVALLAGPTKCDVTHNEFAVAARTFAAMEDGACAMGLLRAGTPVEGVLLRRSPAPETPLNWFHDVEKMVDAVAPASLRLHEWTAPSLPSAGWVEETDGASWDIARWQHWMPDFVAQLAVETEVSVPVGAVDPASLQVWVDGTRDYRWEWRDGAVRWPASVGLAPGSTITVQAVPFAACP